MIRSRRVVVAALVALGALSAHRVPAQTPRASAAGQAPSAPPRAEVAPGNPDWVRPYPAFRIVGNVYWVGGYDLASYLITTSQGHILINTGLAESAAQIASSVASLGFKMSDIKILTATHGHYDHVAAMAELKRTTGAALVVSARDRELFESGGRADFRFGETPGARFAPVSVDRTFDDGGVVSLGGVDLTAHLHAGHTKGATSFTLTVNDAGRAYRVVIANMGSINPGVKMSGMPGYPAIAQDYARTFLAQKDMKVDIWLASHASQFNLHQKHPAGAPYAPERFVDPQGFLAAVQRLEETYLKQVASERGSAR